MSDQKPIRRRISPIFSLSSSRSCADHLVAVPQPDDGEAVFGANPGIAHGQADQRGFGGQDDLRRTDLLGAVDKVVSDLAKRPRLELQGLPHLVDAVVRDVHIGEQYVVGLQFRLRGWAEHPGRKPGPTLDGEEVHTPGAKRQVIEALSDERRAGAYAAALFAIGEAVLLDPSRKAQGGGPSRPAGRLLEASRPRAKSI